VVVGSLVANSKKLGRNFIILVVKRLYKVDNGKL
jgi:hypothetical protein